MYLTMSSMLMIPRLLISIFYSVNSDLDRSYLEYLPFICLFQCISDYS